MFCRFVQKFLIFTALIAGLPCGVYATTRNPGSTSTEGTYQIGQKAQGGIIFWVTADKKHGLVASLADIEIGTDNLFEWRRVVLSAADLPIGATARGVWITAGPGESVISSGKINTDLICAACASSPTDYAAKVCKDYQEGGYTDWYLPSLEELDLMMAMQKMIVASGGESFEKNVYWSSLESFSVAAPQISTAWSLNFATAIELDQEQSNVGRVRACRAF